MGEDSVCEIEDSIEPNFSSNMRNQQEQLSDKYI